VDNVKATEDAVRGVGRGATRSRRRSSRVAHDVPRGRQRSCTASGVRGRGLSSCPGERLARGGQFRGFAAGVCHLHAMKMVPEVTEPNAGTVEGLLRPVVSPAADAQDAGRCHRGAAMGLLQSSSLLGRSSRQR
jgi:hypothetical protein